MSQIFQENTNSKQARTLSTLLIIKHPSVSEICTFLHQHVPPRLSLKAKNQHIQYQFTQQIFTGRPLLPGPQDRGVSINPIFAFRKISSCMST